MRAKYLLLPLLALAICAAFTFAIVTLVNDLDALAHRVQTLEPFDPFRVAPSFDLPRDPRHQI